LQSSDLVVGVFEFVLLVFSLSFHECAHAWMASRLGDQTARMQGRVTLNPLPHIDPFGTILYPALVIFGPILGFNLPFMLIGWAKPTPVITRNFKRIVRDDNLVTLAGPAANLILILLAFLVLATICVAVPGGRGLVLGSMSGRLALNAPSNLQAVVVLAVVAVEINLTLFFFNLLPIPPLDGSRVVRNLLPYNAVQRYDRIGGWLSILLMILVGGFVLGLVMRPVFTLIYLALAHL
jgi:Zn-dependent protease